MLVKPEFDFDTDHRLLVTSLSTPMTRKARKKPKYKPRKLSLDINSLIENSIETPIS